MKLSANFTLDELIKSDVAERKDINNNPSPEQIENIKALTTNILQPIRSHFDKPLIIRSGFRCAQLNIEIILKNVINISAMGLPPNTNPVAT
jgi:zinc D-Ala-D-Ala carboxypeptidase